MAWALRPQVVKHGRAVNNRLYSLVGIKLILSLGKFLLSIKKLIIYNFCYSHGVSSSL